jgi:hypothetical protein
MGLDCPVGCTTFSLGAKFNNCNKEYKFGEITEIAVMANDKTGFTNVEDLAEWATKITANDVEVLEVKADLGEAEQEENNVGKGVIIDGIPHYSVAFEIFELTPENLALVDKVKCNPLMKVWLKSENFTLGGNSGFVNATMKLNLNITEGMNKIDGVLRFRAKDGLMIKKAPFTS